MKRNPCGSCDCKKACWAGDHAGECEEWEEYENSRKRMLKESKILAIQNNKVKE